MLEYPLHGASLGRWYGEPGLPMRQDPPLDIANMHQRKVNPLHLVPILLQKLLDVSVWWQTCLSGFTLEFLSWFTPLAFTSPKTPTRQWGYLPIVGVWFSWWFYCFNNMCPMPECFHLQLYQSHSFISNKETWISKTMVMNNCNTKEVKIIITPIRTKEQCYTTYESINESRWDA